MGVSPNYPYLKVTIPWSPRWWSAPAKTDLPRSSSRMCTSSASLVDSHTSTSSANGDTFDKLHLKTCCPQLKLLYTNTILQRSAFCFSVDFQANEAQAALNGQVSAKVGQRMVFLIFPWQGYIFEIIPGEKPRHCSALFWSVWRKQAWGRPDWKSLSLQAWKVKHFTGFLQIHFYKTIIPPTFTFYQVLLWQQPPCGEAGRHLSLGLCSQWGGDEDEDIVLSTNLWSGQPHIWWVWTGGCIQVHVNI